MSLITLALVLSLGLYLMFVLFFLTGLFRLKPAWSKSETDRPPVTVVVAARNEAENLPGLLSDLVRQDYPTVKLEIIIVDDRSSDETWDRIQKVAAKYPQLRGLQIRQPSPSMASKKYALTKAIESAAGAIIVATDADCRVPETWVASMIRYFDDDTGVVVGYSAVALDPDNRFNRYQQLDFLALMAANAGSLGWDRVVSGSGQNMAFRKSLFFDIGGFEQIADNASGDDVFLIISMAAKTRVAFNSSPDGFVTTSPIATVVEFIRQRTRWSFDIGILIRHYPAPLIFLGTAFFCNLLLLSNLLIPSLRQLPVLTIFALKMIFDLAVIMTGAVKFKQRVDLRIYLLWALLQPLYIPVIGLLGLAGKFHWKR